MADAKFVYSIVIRTTPEKLWDALTKPEFTRQYWCEIVHETTWEPGAPWLLRLPDGRVGDSGQIVEIEKPRKIVFKWRNEFVPAMRTEGYSRCTIELEPVGDAVKLTIVHEADAKDANLIEGVSQGWPSLLSSLKSLLETGEALEITKKLPKGM